MKKALLTLLFLTAPACAEPLKIAMAIPSYAHGLLWIAQDGGFFKKHGVDAQVLVVQGSADAMRLLVAGKLDVALAGGDALVKADLAGADLVAFAGFVNRFFHRIVVRDDVREAAQLKGRAVGLPFLGGPQDMAVQVALKRWGLGYGTDVKVRSMGAEYARLAAVQKGLVDAVTSDATPSVLRSMHLRVLGDVPQWNVAFPYMMAISRREFVVKRRDASDAVLASLLEAMDFYRDHKKESLAILEKHLASEKDAPSDSAELYAQNGPSTYTFPPYAKAEGFKSVLEMLGASDPRAAAAKPERFFTDEVLDRVRGTGNKG